MVLLTVFKARSRIGHNRLRWIPGALLPKLVDDWSSSHGCNLLGLWVYATSSKSNWRHLDGVVGEQLTILLSSGLDINKRCTTLGPPLHTMLTFKPKRGSNLGPAGIQCLLDHGADATILGPYGTPLEIARKNLLSHEIWGTTTSLDYFNNSAEIVQLLEEHLNLVMKRQHAIRALPSIDREVAGTDI